MTDGIVLIDKPAGSSSAYFSRKVGRCFGEKRVGHGGTLDPMASGLLVVMMGQTTKLSRFLLTGDKQYIATAIFGVASTTLDSEGDLTVTAAAPTDLQNVLQNVLPQFVGDITQLPPMTSAIKHKGRRLYEYARKGIEVEIKPRPVCIHEIELLGVNGNSAQLLVHCSGGTYIRSLIRDIGAAVGCDAYMSALQRTASTPYSLDDAVTWDTLENASPIEKEALLQDGNRLLLHLPPYVLPLHDIQRLGQGQRLFIDFIAGYLSDESPTVFRIVDENNRLAGIAQYHQQVMNPIYLFHWTRIAYKSPQ